MEIWHAWLELIQNCIQFLHTQVGLPEALAVIAFTLLVKAMLMPLSIKASYQAHKNRLALKKLAPEIEHIKQVYKNAPEEVAKRTMALYKRHGIKFIDKNMLWNLGSQSAVGLGIYHVLRNMSFNGKFLWIANIAKPDLYLALAVGAITAFSMILMPSASEHSLLMFATVSAVMSILVLMHMPSVLGLYWAASNIVTMGQSVVLRWVFAREGKLAAGS